MGRSSIEASYKMDASCTWDYFYYVCPSNGTLSNPNVLQDGRDDRP